MSFANFFKYLQILKKTGLKNHSKNKDANSSRNKNKQCLLFFTGKGNSLWLLVFRFLSLPLPIYIEMAI